MTNQPASSRAYGMERQLKIYQGGLMGQRPSVSVPLALLEQNAKEVLSPEAYDYVAGGAGGEETMSANLRAFQRRRIVPRMFRNVSQRDLSLELFGHRLPAPFILGPIGVQSIVHREAEVAVARAAATLGVPFVLSSTGQRRQRRLRHADQFRRLAGRIWID